MIVKTVCSMCGFEPATGEGIPSVCPRCGKPFPGRPITSRREQATIIEHASNTRTESSDLRSTPAGNHKTGPLPRSIDGLDIVSLLGSGGMGSVYLAYDPLLDREVALKVLGRSESHTGRTRNAARFLSEAVLTGKLGHAGIIPIYRVGYDPTHGYCYAMRYIKGRSLWEILQALAARDPDTCQSFSLNKLLTIFLKVCEAIAFAHERGIIHRDIKPGNIMVADFGEVFVVDWGLAKQALSEIASAIGNHDEGAAERLARFRRRREATTQLFLHRDDKQPSGKTSYLKQLQAARGGAQQQPITESAQILGTPGYLSPEQGAGQSELTYASDVYSLGVTLYEILTLHLPVEGTTAVELIANTVAGKTIPLQQRAESIRFPNALRDIVNRATAFKPEERYCAARELAEDLSLYLDGKAAWKEVLARPFTGENVSKDWKVLSGTTHCVQDVLSLEPDTQVACQRHVLGDFRCEFEFWAASGATSWLFSIRIAEILSNNAVAQRYEVRVGTEERPFIELLRNGHRVQRRFDVRLQCSQKYRVCIELEQSYVRVAIDGRKYIDYCEAFPQAGGAIEFGATHSQISISVFTLVSRGAPLHLSFMVLPDSLYRTGRYSEARELYRHLAISHPDREEGLLALYKAGLCSTALNELQVAFDEFTRLEGTLFDHCCALGLAHIGMRDRNIDWAWEALKNGYRRHRSDAIRVEMWFALLGLIEQLDFNQHAEKVRRLRELLSELDPEPHEAGQLAFELLDVLQRAEGWAAMREEAVRLLREFSKNRFVQAEAVTALSRGGFNQESLDLVTAALDHLIENSSDAGDRARFNTLRAEIFISDDNYDEAARCLRDALLDAGPFSAPGLWAKSWQILIHYLQQQYQQTLTESHEVLARFRHSGFGRKSYFHLLEGLALLGKKQPLQATQAFAAAGKSSDTWGLCALHILAQNEPSTLEANLCQSCPSQLSEALYLAAEAHLRAGKTGLAESHLARCTNGPSKRIMIAKLAEKGLIEIKKSSEKSNANPNC